MRPLSRFDQSRKRWTQQDVFEINKRLKKKKAVAPLGRCLSFLGQWTERDKDGCIIPIYLIY